MIGDHLVERKGLKQVEKKDLKKESIFNQVISSEC